MIDKEAELFLVVKKRDGEWFVFSVTDSDRMFECYNTLVKHVIENNRLQGK